MNRMLYTYGAIVVIGWIGFAGYELIDWRCLTATEWAAWVGAIGTILAFAGTIWIATSQQRKEDRRRKMRAELTAAGLSSKLGGMRGYIKGICIALQRTAAENNSIENLREIQQRLAKVSLLTLDQIEPLFHLQNGIGLDLVQAMDDISTTCDSFAKALETNPINFLEERKKLAMAYSFVLTDACDRLQVAGEKCDEIVNRLNQ